MGPVGALLLAIGEGAELGWHAAIKHAWRFECADC